MNLVSIGLCGRLFVCAELTRRNFTIKSDVFNLHKTDIVVNDIAKDIIIRVKTRKSNTNNWVLTNKDETNYGKNIFYIFVSLNENGTPDYYIVPSEFVAKCIYVNHKEWELSRPIGSPISNVRKFKLDKDSKYKNNWLLINNKR